MLTCHSPLWGHTSYHLSSGTLLSEKFPFPFYLYSFKSRLYWFRSRSYSCASPNANGNSMKADWVRFNPLEAQEGIREVSLILKRHCISLWFSVLWSNQWKWTWSALQSRLARALPQSPVCTASLSGVMPSSQCSEQWKIYTSAANKQMVSSLMEDHLKMPQSVFWSSGTTVSWSYCFPEKLTSKGISYVLSNHFTLRLPLC